MNYPDIDLYKDLVGFCNQNKDEIESKFDRDIKFNEFNEKCFIEMYLNIKDEMSPIAPKILKEKIPGLTECYKKMGFKYMSKRNKMIKGLDIQLGQWYEKAFAMFLKSKNIEAIKKGFPYPDFVVNPNNPKAYYELKYIEAPFLSAHNLVKNTYPYDSKRYDYECSLTLDTGSKLQKQREKYELELKQSGVAFYYVWWYDAPHLKGVFYMNALDVFDYWDKVGTLHEREKREGDKIAKQTKGKIYPPLLKMKSLSSLLDDLK